MWEFILGCLGGISSAGSLLQIAITWYGNPRAKNTLSCKELFYSLFILAAFEVLNGHAKEQGFIQKIIICFNQNWIKEQLNNINLDGCYILDSELHGVELKKKYRNLFDQIKKIIDDSSILSQEKCDSIFNEHLDSEAYCLLKNKIRQVRTRNGFEQFNVWLDEQKEASAQTSFLLKSTGIDENLKLKRVKDGCYVPQRLVFSNGNQVLDTRSDVEPPLNWLKRFAEILGETPLLFYAPSGMGKSAFLCYLYDCIANYPGKDNPFEGAFLVSLEGIKQTASPQQDYNGAPLSDPTNSLILNTIASRSGNKNLCCQWKTAFEQGIGLETDKPILLMLDGLNEIFENLPYEKSVCTALYNYILGEIKQLSQFKHVRIIISTRLEARNSNEEKEQVTEQVYTLTPFIRVNTAKLEGISLEQVHDQIHRLGLEQEIPKDSELEKMFCRPMYYNHMEAIEGKQNIKTKYDVLREMYRLLSEQSCANTVSDTQKNIRFFLYQYYLPILAYCYKNGCTTWEAAQRKCEQLLQGPLSASLVTNPRIDAVPLQDMWHLLRNQEQILTFIEKGRKKEIVFFHQDYCDYLAAEYFLQRLRYIRDHLDESFLGDDLGDQMDTLRLNTYHFDVLRLIYGGLHFSIDYTNYFSEQVELTPEKITWERLIWYTTAYQLSDLKGLAAVDYNGKLSLAHDTLEVLSPFLKYAISETQNYDGTTAFSRLRPSRVMLQNVVEILMRACELNRSSGQYERALSITAAAEYICKAVKAQGGEDAAMLMQSVVNYNIARIYLHDFMNNDTLEHLDWSLRALYEGTAAQNNPYRFSCNALAMMLVSPQPKLEGTTQYRSFKKEFFGDDGDKKAAFWMYFTAIFDVRKKGESWLPKLYSVRQLLFLLSENKVQVIPHGSFDPLKADLKSIAREYCNRKNFNKFSLYTPEPGSAPIPTIHNLKLIHCFLDLIWYTNQPWKHYFMGLVKLYLSHSIDEAQAEFSADNDNNKAKLWHAYLTKEPERMEEIYQAEHARILADQRENLEINSYHTHAYFERDVGELYRTLRQNLTDGTEFPISLSSPPLRANFAQFLSESFCCCAARELRLSPLEIQLLPTYYPNAKITVLESCPDGCKWVYVTVADDFAVKT